MALNRLKTASALLAGFVCTAAGASVTPYTEQFNSDNANWGTGSAWQEYVPLQWNSGGGPGGASYVSTTQNFGDFSPGPLDYAIFRGQDNYGSSNDAFMGDWIAGGITHFSFWVRHDAPVALKYFVRFVKQGANFPSMNYRFEDSLVQPNTWTQLSMIISPDTPGFIPGGGPGTYESVMGDLGKIQLGIDLAPLAGDATDYNFDLTLVAMNVPAPGALGLLGLALLGARRRRS